jgi:hypothetical protein
MSVYENKETAGPAAIEVVLNHGGTSVPHQQVTLNLALNSAAASAFDVTKTYSVTIEEEA